VHLDPGASQAVKFELKPCDLGIVTEAGEPIIAEGQYKISVGGGQPGTGAPAAAGTFQVKGKVTLPE
jgi:beta-glucosidase